MTFRGARDPARARRRKRGSIGTPKRERNEPGKGKKWQIRPRLMVSMLVYCNLFFILILSHCTTSSSFARDISHFDKQRQRKRRRTKKKCRIVTDRQIDGRASAAGWHRKPNKNVSGLNNKKSDERSKPNRTNHLGSLLDISVASR